MMSNQRYAAWIAALAFVGAGLGASAEVWAATTVTSMDFKVVGGESVLELKGDGPLNFTTQENAQDRQLVIDLADTRLGPSASRRLDTSSFNSKVTLVSPYQVDSRSGENASRVVVQLRDWVAPQVKPQGNLLRISVPNDSMSLNSAASEDPVPEPSARGPQQADESVAMATNRRNVPEGAPSEIQSFLDNREARQFTGRPVTLQLKEAELSDVFGLIAEASGFNIVMSDDVKGKITLSLTDVPWDQALDLVLRSQRLGAERNYNVLRVLTLENLTKEKKAELEAQAAQAASTPRVTRIFPVNYARLRELTDMLNRFAATSPLASAVSGANYNETVMIQADERTNSIVVRDTPANVEKMRRLIELLDAQTPQIVVEAKIVEAQEGFGNSLDGSIGIRGGNGAAVSFNRGNISTGGLLSTASPAIPSGTTAGASAVALSPNISLFGGNANITARLNALLQIQESESKLKIIASPRTVVLNKESSTIVQAQPVVVQTFQTNPQNGLNVATSTIANANLSLKVQPSVTNDGAVLMDLDINRDIPVSTGGQSAVAGRNLKTKVLVDSGSTLVIGGIYTSREETSESGTPFLRNIPIFGALFGSKSKSVDRNELFVFVTPRILNEKQAGLGGG